MTVHQKNSMGQITTIKLDSRERRVIFSSLSEYGGGSASAMKLVSGHSDEAISSVRLIFNEFWNSESEALALTEGQWRVVYDSINATIYALGPFELETCTGCDPIEMLETNLTIASRVWGAYGGAKWCDYYRATRI